MKTDKALNFYAKQSKKETLPQFGKLVSETTDKQTGHVTSIYKLPIVAGLSFDGKVTKMKQVGYYFSYIFATNENETLKENKSINYFY